MDARALQNILEVFNEFKAAVPRQSPPKPGKVEEDSKLVTIGSRVLFLQGEALAQYEKFMGKWRKYSPSANWSQKHLEDRVKVAMGEAWANPQNAAGAFSNAASDLEKPSPRFTVLIPIAGVDFQLDQFVVGRVKLVRLSMERAAELVQLADKVVDSTTNPDDQKASLRQHNRELIGSLTGTMCAEIIEQGDPTIAQSRAEAACLPAIDVLQFIAGIYEHSARNIKIDFRAFEASGFRPVLMFSEDQKHFQLNHNRFGAAGALVLNTQRIEHLEKDGLLGIVKILDKEEHQRTEIEKFILRAVHWFADATLQRNDESQLQSYVTCLDMFFSSRDGEVSAAVKEGVAYTLGQNVEHRKYLHSFIEEVYDYRSRASHEGEQLNLEAKLLELKIITVNFIAEMLRRPELKTKKALKKWIHEQKMA